MKDELAHGTSWAVLLCYSKLDVEGATRLHRRSGFEFKPDPKLKQLKGFLISALELR
jgi:hypothetical protein